MDLVTEGGITVTAAVPSGASTGVHEAAVRVVGSSNVMQNRSHNELQYMTLDVVLYCIIFLLHHWMWFCR